MIDYVPTEGVKLPQIFLAVCMDMYVYISQDS
jgi:hypothetical protein